MTSTTQPPAVRGVLAAILTPVDGDFAPAAGPLIAHARWLLANGCDGLNVLGTTGEFASFSVAQRLAVMEAVAGADLARVSLAGTGTSNLAETVELTQRSVDLGFAGALVIPPFYYKDVDEDGVFAYYARLIERVGDPRLRVYLYHYPRMSGVAFTRQLIARLTQAFPAAIAGVKDSAGDMAFVRALRRDAPALDIFPASESALLEGRDIGCAGCISATLNTTAPFAQAVWTGTDRDAVVRAQARIAAMRAAIVATPLIPGLHALVSRLQGADPWARLMPPNYALDDESLARLDAAAGAAGLTPADVR